MAATQEHDRVDTEYACPNCGENRTDFLATSDRDHPYITCQTCGITYPDPLMEVADDRNPRYLFATTHSDLLAALLRAEVDLNALARAEMANRGLDRDGKWIGHQAAAALWRKGVPAG